MRIHVLGGGIIGLASADELLTRGHDVVVVDPAPGSGASAVAAGMLSPGGEAWHGEPDGHRLGAASARLWPSYAARLGVPLHEDGVLLVGHDAGDRQLVLRQAELLQSLDVEAEPLGGGDLRRLEPSLGRVAGGIRLQERAVDPRSVVAALLLRLGARVRRSAPRGEADVVVVATGSTLPEPWSSLVRGVRGEVVRLRTDDAPRHVVRGWVAGEPVYLVPRPGGEVVVGATVEEHDDGPRPTAGGVLRLLRAARVLVPALDRAEVLACEARDRPATRDHLPLVGPTHHPWTFLAAGHFRHGVLLAPLTARLLADAVEGADPDPAVDPRRLLPEPVPAAPDPSAPDPGGPQCT
ncbi:FAD-dependent oxidoreductase [Nocardioides sp.]|uniref:FAD-dependent oxidoreductase n=1 Tax=Nocardioides sp. TaxID=35761 RepID=UPI0035B04717